MERFPDRALQASSQSDAPNRRRKIGTGRARLAFPAWEARVTVLIELCWSYSLRGGVAVSYSEAGLDDLERGLDLLLNGGSAVEAADAFRSAARHGVAEAYLQLARLERENGNDAAVRDLVAQVEGLASQGDALANLSMALFHEFKEGDGDFDEEERKSRRYMRQAAELGHPVAQLMLAQRLHLGLEGEAEDQSAYEIWIMRAIEQGLGEAVITYCRNRLNSEQDLEPWMLTKLKELASQSEEAQDVLKRATEDPASSRSTLVKMRID